MAQRKQIASPQPSILALKNIVSKIRDQICMRSLTIAIRQHCLEQQQTHLKQNYLRFFLQCEGRLRRDTTAEWNRVIDLQIKRIVGCEKLFLFVRRKMLCGSFQKINFHAQLDQIAKIQEKICEEFDGLKDMQISQDVKVKTKYFFKWCQFISEKNQIKKMRNKQLQDLKKSKIFNQYSSKFSSFMKWKQYIRRIKYIKSKGIQLENKTKNKKLQSIFAQIKEKIQIIAIEKMLEIAVANKLQNFGLRNVFLKLRQNKLKEDSLKSRLRKRGNIWLYRFYGQFKKRSTVLFNKSSVSSRQQIEVQYQQLCKLICWKGLKLKVKQTKEKVAHIRLTLKRSSFKSFVKQSFSKKHISTKRKEFITYHKGNSLKGLIYAAKFTVENRNEKTTQQKIVTDLINRTYFNIFKDNLIKMKKDTLQFKQKSIALEGKSQNSGKKRFLEKLTNIQKNRIDFTEKIISLQKYIGMNLFQFRIQNFKIWKAQKKQLDIQLQAKHNLQLMKISLKGLRSYKKVKIGELQAFSSVYNLIDSKIKSQTLAFLKQRTQTTKKLEKLMKVSEYIALKVSFITILNKMLSKKMKIKNFSTKKDTQLKRKLFNMLLSNSEHLHLSMNKAQLFYFAYIKKQFLHNMAQQLQEVSKQKLATKMLEKNRKSMLYKRFKERNQKREQCEISQQTLNNMVKTIRFQEFYHSAKGLVGYRREEEKKTLKVQKCAVRSYIKRMREFLKDRKKRFLELQSLNAHYSNLMKQVQLVFATKALKSMLRQADISLNKKEQKLKSYKAKQLFQQLKFNKSDKFLQKQLKNLRSTELTTIFLDKRHLKQKRQKLKAYLQSQKQKRALRVFKNNVIADAQERQIKEKQLQNYLATYRIKQSKKIIITKLMTQHQLQQNFSILCNKIAAQGFKALINGYFTLKSEQLRQLAALKHYALNVKRRGMRALKYSINISLLKQNRAKTQNHSKMLMEKSMDNARKKSKLMETIERYNMSRVSRVLR